MKDDKEDKEAEAEAEEPEVTVTIRSRGQIFEIPFYHTQRWPDTKLAKHSLKAKLEQNSDEIQLKYNRNPTIFHHVMEFYHTGQLHVPGHVCMQSFLDEMSYWNIDHDLVSPCCRDMYEEELATRALKDAIAKKYWQDDLDTERMSCTNRMWTFFQFPDSSIPALVWSYISTLLVITSLVILAIDTLPQCRETSSYNDLPINSSKSEVLLFFENSYAVAPLVYLDFAVCSAIVLEYIFRFIAAPSRSRFLMSFENTVSFFSILPSLTAGILYFIRDYRFPFMREPAFLTFLSIFYPFRVLRVVCLIRYGQYYAPVRVIVLTVQSSFRAILLVVAMLFAMSLFYGGCLFYAELDEGTVDSIARGMWWATVTMTTVGYGDYYPVSGWGYPIGCVCAVTGLMIITLPIAIISINFSKYHDLIISIAKEREQERRARKMKFAYTSKL